MSGGTVLGSIEAALRLLLRDRRALERFDTSFEGFWRSFFAMLLSAPLYIHQSQISHEILNKTPMAEGQPKLAIQVPVTIDLLAFAAVWLAFPLAMIGIVRLLKREAQYVPYIIVYNWSSFLFFLLLFVPTALYSLGLANMDAVAFLRFIGLGVWAYFLTYVARTVLMVTFAAAVGLVIFDFLLGQLVQAPFYAPYVSTIPATSG